MNRSRDTVSLLELLRIEAPEFYAIAEVVGKWVWIRFEDRQPPTVTSVLSKLGFHWNKARQAWQHPCGVFCDVGATVDPRQRYSRYSPANDRRA